MFFLVHSKAFSWVFWMGFWNFQFHIYFVLCFFFFFSIFASAFKSWILFFIHSSVDLHFLGQLSSILLSSWISVKYLFMFSLNFLISSIQFTNVITGSASWFSLDTTSTGPVCLMRDLLFWPFMLLFVFAIWFVCVTLFSSLYVWTDNLAALDWAKVGAVWLETGWVRLVGWVFWLNEAKLAPKPWVWC